MLKCPQCTKPLREVMRRCPTCQADLDLLVDYVSHLQGGLERAENLVRAGELGPAVWAYLEVLEVDPDNGPARKQIGQVVTAVRQFDTVIPGRRWANGLPPLPNEPPSIPTWLMWSLVGTVVILLAFSSFMLGRITSDWTWPTPAPSNNDPPLHQKNDAIGARNT